VRRCDGSLAQSESAMRRISPRVFLIGASELYSLGLKRYFDHIGTAWRPERPQGRDPEALIEIMGRLCYRSWCWFGSEPESLSGSVSSRSAS